MLLQFLGGQAGSFLKVLAALGIKPIDTHYIPVYYREVTYYTRTKISGGILNVNNTNHDAHATRLSRQP